MPCSLQLSTLHTLCADDTVSRLRQLGLEAAQAGPALSLVLAQRLVRQLCPDSARAAVRGDATGRSWLQLGEDPIFLLGDTDERGAFGHSFKRDAPT